MNKKVILMILDGWGIGTNPEISAINKANTPFIDSLYSKYPHSKLEASGLAVGLPKGQMGNSEVGHMNLGAGRVVYQDLVRLNKAAEDGSLAKNKEYIGPDLWLLIFINEVFFLLKFDVIFLNFFSFPIMMR